MQKGLSVPLLLILLTLFAASGLGYISYSISTKNIKTDVQGASIVPKIDKGFSILINSTDTWDFFEYLCKTKEECENSLNSGKRNATVSGGATTNHEVVIAKSDDWNDFEFIKIYVRPGWGSRSNNFNLDMNSLEKSLLNKSFFESQISHEVVLIPISMVDNTFVDTLATFSDN